MSPEIKKKWVEALRSGKYEQATGVLRSEDDCYCVLGVLYDVNNGKWKRSHNRWVSDRNHASFSKSFQEEVGIPDDFVFDIALMNDGNKGRKLKPIPFEDLADYIEGVEI